jgi:hypothetical protein
VATGKSCEDCPVWAAKTGQKSQSSTGNHSTASFETNNKKGITMTVNEQLEKLADDEGVTTIGPDADDEQALKGFQSEVRRLRALADEGVIEIIGQPHQESHTGRRYIDRVRVRLTASGDELRKAIRNE